MKIKGKIIVLIAVLLVVSINTYGQDRDEEQWYENPLGFDPLNLHTSMSFIVPAIAVGVCLLVTKKDSTLAQRLSIYDEVGLSWGYKYPYTFMPQTNLGINYQLRKFMSVGIELGAYFPHDDFNRTTGFAVRPFARFYPVNKKTWRLYFESGGGFIYLLDEFPQPTDWDDRLGTQWNGVTKYGIGSDFNISESTSIMLGVRHVHISNGNAKGVERNPSHDSNGFFVGATYRIK